MKQVPYWAPTDISRHSQRFIRPDDVARRICSSLVCTTYRWLTWRWWNLNRKLSRRILGNVLENKAGSVRVT